jgi:putative membrane protein
MPTCETFAQPRLRARPAEANYFRRAGLIDRSMIMNFRRLARGLSLGGLIIAAAAPTLAVSLPATGPDIVAPQPAPQMSPTQALVADGSTAGAAALIPVVATDAPANPISMVDAPADGGATAGKPVDDIQFVRQATESGRNEAQSARDALPQLKKAELRQIAEMLASDHANANAKLARIAEAKGWPVPGPRAPAAQPTGTAAPDFDAKWTAEMIERHEKSVALYRAQVTGGEDKDLRKYASETLPTIERHLAQLRSLHK